MTLVRPDTENSVLWGVRDTVLCTRARAVPERPVRLPDETKYCSPSG